MHRGFAFSVLLAAARASAMSIASNVKAASPIKAVMSIATNVKTASPKTSPVIIIPGFGNDSVDYITPLEEPEERGFKAALTRRGFTDIEVMSVKRLEWARVILGLLASLVYKPWAVPEGPAYSWFINRLRDDIAEAHKRSGGGEVLLIGHSAGGWLARAALASGGTGGELSDKVSGLVTLGTPHFPPPEGFQDMTLGVLRSVNDDFPGAFLKSEGVAYVTVGGDAIVGNDSREPPTPADKAQQQEVLSSSESANKAYALRGEGNAERVAYNSYQMTCGRGDVTGDGVVPLEWTHLEGATQVTLKGVLHSINEAGTTIPTDRWYGSENVVDKWLPTVLEQIEATRAAGGAVERVEEA